MSSRSASRRLFLKTLTLAAAAGAMPAERARAADLPKLSTADPAAAALGYVENAAQVDTKKYPAYVKGSTCENCMQLQGKAGNNYRPCAIFPGKLVAISGWCSSWAAEM
jgi:hypothetical protein